jgi:hypothetical protein
VLTSIIVIQAEKEKMEQLIGTNVKTHNHAYLGEVRNVSRLFVKPIYRHLRGIEANEPYVAYAVEIEGSDSPKGWTTLIARDEADILKRYAV